MLEAIWFVVNVLIGVPIGVLLIVSGREAVRAALAVALGFRVFELKWGAGRRILTRSVGPIDCVIGAVPIAASTLAESGSPRRHRIARLAQAAGPLSIQIAWLCWSRWSGAVPLDATLGGPAPLAALELANGLLVAIHLLIPLESPTGDRTDVRSILDIVFARPEEGRHARASFYARYACHWLERGDVARAASILERGVTQLGRDPLVVDCQTRVLARDLDSVVDQGECAQALRAMIESDTPRRHAARADAGLRERVRRATIGVLPVALASLGWLALESEHVVRLIDQRFAASSVSIAKAGDASECEAQLLRWRRWMPLIDVLATLDANMLRDRYRQLSRLEHCRGRLDAAVAHQYRANQAAERTLARSGGERATSDPERRRNDEILLATLLRETAELESERRRFRVALETLWRAESRLDHARNRLGRSAWDEPEMPGEAPIERETERIQMARNEILARMSAN